MTTGARFTLRAGVTLLIFACLYCQLDVTRLRAEFATLAAAETLAWALAALALSLPQVVISAWRWRLTARCMGLRLGLADAVREYYLATFLNQVLPGGVLGDAGRAWRHGRHGRRRDDAATAAYAVVIERVSGQLALAVVAFVALAGAPDLRRGLGEALAAIDAPTAVLVPVAALICVALLAAAGGRHAGLAGAAARLRDHIRRALLGARVWRLQLFSSLLVTATYIGVFICGARAIGVAMPIAELWVLVPPVLMAMAIPLSIAGWGIREGAAALVWMLAGLPAHEGVAVSLTYGTLVLVSSLPGAFMLLARPPQPLAHQRAS